MTNSKLQAYKFSVGEKVAYYSSKVLIAGEVVTVEDSKVVITIGDKDCFEFVLREKDGLFIPAECISQKIPTRMIAPLHQIEAINKWRYPESLPKKLKQLARLLRGLLPRD